MVFRQRKVQLLTLEGVEGLAPTAVRVPALRSAGAPMRASTPLTSASPTA